MPNNQQATDAMPCLEAMHLQGYISYSTNAYGLCSSHRHVPHDLNEAAAMRDGRAACHIQDTAG
jgi:hypothetical protein